MAGWVGLKDLLIAEVKQPRRRGMLGGWIPERIEASWGQPIGVNENL